MLVFFCPPVQVPQSTINGHEGPTNRAINDGIPLASPFAGGEPRMRTEERRDISTRAAVVQRVINGVVQNPSVTLTVDTLQAWLDIPVDAAQRILQRLASSGLVREVQKGVWARGTWPGAQRDWY
jgi:hypothetical protein